MNIEHVAACRMQILHVIAAIKLQPAWVWQRHCELKSKIMGTIITRIGLSVNTKYGPLYTHETVP